MIWKATQGKWGELEKWQENGFTFFFFFFFLKTEISLVLTNQ